MDTDRIVPEEGFEICDACSIEVYEEIRDYARNNLPCVFFGPTGCGKEFAASYYRQVWKASGHGNGPYCRVNCSALTENIAYSELFGHTKGAFTDAKFDKKGWFCIAQSGVLFLDEIGDLPASVQPMLLRAIDAEAASATPLGSSIPYDTDKVRVLAATDQPREKIRPALLNRLGIQIDIPAMEDRPKDRDAAIVYFANLALRKRRDFENLCIDLLKIAPPAEDDEKDPDMMCFAGQVAESLRPLVCERAWPGNFRQLRVAIDVAVIRPALEKNRALFAHEAARFLARHLDRSQLPAAGRGKALFAAASQAIDREDPLYQRLNAVLPNLSEPELNKWAVWLRQYPDQAFGRPELERYFAGLGYRAILNRLHKLVAAQELEQFGARNQYFRRVTAQPAMPVLKRQEAGFLDLPAIRDESVLSPEAVAAVIALIQKGPHVYLGGAAKTGKTPTALAAGQKLARERAVYYYRFDDADMAPFFKLIMAQLVQEKIIATAEQIERLPLPEQALVLAGYVAQLLQKDDEPLFILDQVQVLGRETCSRALLNLLMHWSFAEFLLVGTKLDLERPDAVSGRIVEYVIPAR